MNDNEKYAASMLLGDVDDVAKLEQIIKDALPQIKAKANLMGEVYKAFVKAGFTPEQSLELMLRELGYR